MTPRNSELKKLIWWGRGDAAYSRNGVVRSAIQDLGWSIYDVRPNKLVSWGLMNPRGLPHDATVVWVPCFRQRDVAGAARWAKQHGATLVFDPLISAYDKQVFERQKFPENSSRAKRLLAWERQCFARADRVLADTQAHADYFHQMLGVPADRLVTVPVGADDQLFVPSEIPQAAGRRISVLFYGSFIHLQGPKVIVQAARRCPEVDWVLLGDGPLRKTCEQLATGHANISFEPWIAYDRLPARIASADVLLGVFADSDKAARVVPNKVYQAMACGRPVVTRQPFDGVYAWDTEATSADRSGVVFVPPNDPTALAEAVRTFASSHEHLQSLGTAAAQSFAQHYSRETIRSKINDALHNERLSSNSVDSLRGAGN